MPDDAAANEPTHTYADRPNQVVLESGKPDRYAHTYRGYLVQAHDAHGRLLWDTLGRPVLVPQGSQVPEHPLGRAMGTVYLFLGLLLLALCIIGGIGLHYLDQLAHPSLF